MPRLDPFQMRAKLVSLRQLESAFNLVTASFSSEQAITEQTTDCPKDRALPLPQVSYPKWTCRFIVSFNTGIFYVDIPNKIQAPGNCILLCQLCLKGKSDLT